MSCILEAVIAFVYLVVGGFTFSGLNKTGWAIDASIVFAMLWPLVLTIWLGIAIGNRIF